MGGLSAVARHTPDRPVHIYGLADPRNGECFYIGITARSIRARLGNHNNDALVLKICDPRCEIIRSIVHDGLKVDAFEIETVPASKWAETEEFWIENMRAIGCKLTNKSTGGNGAKGAKQSEKTRMLRSKAAKERGAYMMHTPLSRERAAVSLGTPVIVNGIHYRSRRHAAEMSGVPYSTIAYRENPRPLKGYPSGRNNHNSKPIIVDGVEFSSKLAAVKHLGSSYKTINRSIRRGTAQYID